MKKLLFVLLVFISSIVYGQKEGETITLKGGGKLKSDLTLNSNVTWITPNSKITIIKYEKYDYYLVKTEKDSIGYMNSVWFSLTMNADFHKPIDDIEISINEYGNSYKVDTYSSGDYKSKTYTWTCSKGKYRTITFVYKNFKWVKDSEYTSECL